MWLEGEVDSSYPIILGVDGPVMDAMHLIARAILEGGSTIQAVRFGADPNRMTGPAHLASFPLTGDRRL